MVFAKELLLKFCLAYYFLAQSYATVEEEKNITSILTDNYKGRQIIRMVNPEGDVYLTVQKAADCQEELSSIIKNLQEELQLNLIDDPDKLPYNRSKSYSVATAHRNISNCITWHLRMYNTLESDYPRFLVPLLLLCILLIVYTSSVHRLNCISEKNKTSIV